MKHCRQRWWKSKIVRKTKLDFETKNTISLSDDSFRSEWREIHMWIESHLGDFRVVNLHNERLFGFVARFSYDLRAPSEFHNKTFTWQRVYKISFILIEVNKSLCSDLFTLNLHDSRQILEKLMMFLAISGLGIRKYFERKLEDMIIFGRNCFCPQMCFGFSLPENWRFSSKMNQQNYFSDKISSSHHQQLIRLQVLYCKIARKETFSPRISLGNSWSGTFDDVFPTVKLTTN